MRPRITLLALLGGIVVSCLLAIGVWWFVRLQTPFSEPLPHATDIAFGLLMLPAVILLAASVHLRWSSNRWASGGVIPVCLVWGILGVMPWLGIRRDLESWHWFAARFAAVVLLGAAALMSQRGWRGRRAGGAVALGTAWVIGAGCLVALGLGVLSGVAVIERDDLGVSLEAPYPWKTYESSSRDPNDPIASFGRERPDMGMRIFVRPAALDHVTSIEEARDMVETHIRQGSSFKEVRNPRARRISGQDGYQIDYWVENWVTKTKEHFSAWVTLHRGRVIRCSMRGSDADVVRREAQRVLEGLRFY